MKKDLFKKQPVAAKPCQTIVNKPLLTTLLLITKLLYSLKALNTYTQEGNFGLLFLITKYLASETMLPGADTIW